VDAAAASALMESIETWHAEHIQLPRVRGRSARFVTAASG
jgi:ribosomal protein S12 methylthiotransferase accessory factor YcaO